MKKIIIDWLFHSRAPRLYDDVACALRCNCGELFILEIKDGEMVRKID